MLYNCRITSENDNKSYADNYYDSSNAMSNFQNSSVLFPNHSENDSNLMNFGISHSISSNHQPISNSYDQFLTRTIENDPQNLYEGISSPGLPMFFLLTDSHGKYLPPVFYTPSYKIIVKPISGLQWTNQFDKNLCTKSLIFSQSISSNLSSCAGVLFLIGTNSVRNTSAPRIIEQIENIIDLIRFHYSNLQQNNSISITSVFPCIKPSKMFPSISSLSLNINHYNTLLQNSSIRKRFSIVHIPIGIDHLNKDGMHICYPYTSILWESIHQYFTTLFIEKSTVTRSLPRSRAATIKRNRKQHEKMNRKRKNYFLIKNIDNIWTIKNLKDYLKCKNIKYGHLLEIRRNKLYVYFNNIIQKQESERILNLIDFDRNTFSDWSHASTDEL